MGSAQPQGAYYAAALAASGVPAGDAVFVDDTAANVAAARDAGLRAYRYRGADELAWRLRECGLSAEV